MLLFGVSNACRRCSKSLPSGHTKYCSLRCAKTVHKRRMRAKVPTATKQCKNCSAPFCVRVTNTKKIHCSRQCATAYRDQAKAKRQLGKLRAKQWRTACRWCGGKCTLGITHKVRHYCSRKCMDDYKNHLDGKKGYIRAGRQAAANGG